MFKNKYKTNLKDLPYKGNLFSKFETKEQYFTETMYAKNSKIFTITSGSSDNP